MDQKNQNQTNSRHPFGEYEQKNGLQNRPRDISSDLWTPISTGIPMPGTAKLVDEDERVSPQQTKAQGQKAPARKETRRKAAGKKKSKNIKRDAKTTEGGQPSQKRPVVRQPQSRPAARKTQNAKVEKEIRKEKNAKKQYKKNTEEFHSQLYQGISSDEIRRNKAKKKRRSKRVIAIVIVAVIMVLAAIFAFVYCYAYGAPIATITVEGDSPYATADIIAASGVRTGENMLRVREKEVNQLVSTILPYIASVDVDYQLPDTLLLRVTQAEEKYLIVAPNGYLCLDESGKVLSLKKKKLKENQFRLEGFEPQDANVGEPYSPQGENQKRFQAAQNIVSLLEKNELGKANILDLTDLRTILINYDNRINIYLSDSDELEEKIGLVAGIIKNDISPNSRGYIDARFAHRAFFNENSMTID